MIGCYISIYNARVYAGIYAVYKNNTTLAVTCTIQLKM